MLFNSVDFIIFFPIVVLIYFLIPHRIRYIWLLICSYYFYMCWNPKYIMLLIVSTVITFSSGLLMQKIKESSAEENRKVYLKKYCVVGSFIINLLILGYFKYFEFFVNTIAKALNTIHIEVVPPEFDIVLPVGISFYIFQALSYTMDVYRDEISAEKNLFKYALFVSFFPQLVAGPIERSKNLLAQINEEHKFEYERVRYGLILMLWGFFLKLVIADRIAIFVDAVYDNVETYQGFFIIVATVLFAFQIYCDFEGYTTIARGAACVMGFRLMENFNAPYLSGSVSEFWRNWHISLTSWFRDYLYIPLGGNRKGKHRKYINILTVFGVSGLWHGASWTYVIWGLLNGIYQIVGEMIYPIRTNIERKLKVDKNLFSYRLLRGIGTFILIDFSWLFFRAQGTGKAIKILKNLCVWNPTVLVDGALFQLGLVENNFRFLLVALLILLVTDVYKRKQINLIEKLCRQDMWFRVVALSLMIWTVVILGVYGDASNTGQFIYFQF